MTSLDMFVESYQRFKEFEEFSECFEHFEHWFVALGAFYRAILDSILLSLVEIKFAISILMQDFFHCEIVYLRV